MVATPEKPLGRMTIRRNSINDGQAKKIRLWTIDAPTGSTAERLLKVYLGTFDAIDKLDGAKAAIAANPELTDIGRQKQIRDSIFRDTVPAMHRGRIELAKAREEVAKRRALLVPPKADPTDAAGALRRQETRALLRSMSNDERRTFLSENGSHPEIKQAIIEQPAFHSGLSNVQHDQAINEAMMAAYSPQLAAIKLLEEAIEVTASAIEEGRAETHTEAAAVDPALRDPDRFNAMAAQIENKTSAVWLQAFQENGTEVVRAVVWDDETETRGTWKIATQEQIDSGIVAKTREEYDRLKGGNVIDFSAPGDTAAEARRKRAAFADEHGHEAYLNRNGGSAA